jgi:hypothetical protein
LPVPADNGNDGQTHPNHKLPNQGVIDLGVGDFFCKYWQGDAKHKKKEQKGKEQGLKPRG